MNPSEYSILAGLSVLTVAKIADCAGTLKREARLRPDGKVAGVLVLGYGRVLQSTPPTFTSEANAVQYMDNLVTACVAWQGAHEPACVEDACFSC